MDSEKYTEYRSKKLNNHFLFDSIRTSYAFARSDIKSLISNHWFLPTLFGCGALFGSSLMVYNLYPHTNTIQKVIICIAFVMLFISGMAPVAIFPFFVKKCINHIFTTYQGAPSIKRVLRPDQFRELEQNIRDIQSTVDLLVWQLERTHQNEDYTPEEILKTANKIDQKLTDFESLVDLHKEIDEKFPYENMVWDKIEKTIMDK